ncbi:ornithine cyclodeaminase family protein [Sphingomonas oryzagri]
MITPPTLPRASTDVVDPIYFGADAIDRLLDYPGCISAMKIAMRDLSCGAIPQPLRSIVAIDEGHLFGVMAAALSRNDGYGAKIASVTPDPRQPGRTRHQGIVLFFDPKDGRVVCMGDGEAITRIRTAAASAAATDALARPGARTLAILGAGVQAAAHARAIAQVRPIERILVWSRATPAAKTLAEALCGELSVQASYCTTPTQAVTDADIICTVSGARDPILAGAWVRPGTHINVVGSSYLGPREIDDDLVAGSRFFVDSRASALAAAAEFAHAMAAGRIDESHIVGEIGYVFAGSCVGRTSADDITLYKSLGHAVQDVAALSYAHGVHVRGGSSVGAGSF